MNRRMVKPVCTFAAEAEGEGGNDSGATPAAGDGFKPITSQEELNKVIADRLDRERAKFADYKDLKAKADEFDRLAEANKSELEKANDRAAAAERERDQVRTEATRLRIAAAHGITDAEDIELFLTGSDEDTLTKQAKRLADREADRKKRGNVSPREGNNPSEGNSGDPLRDFTRNLFAEAATE